MPEIDVSLIRLQTVSPSGGALLARFISRHYLKQTSGTSFREMLARHKTVVLPDLGK